MPQGGGGGRQRIDQWRKQGTIYILTKACESFPPLPATTAAAYDRQISTSKRRPCTATGWSGVARGRRWRETDTERHNQRQEYFSEPERMYVHVYEFLNARRQGAPHLECNLTSSKIDQLALPENRRGAGKNRRQHQMLLPRHRGRWDTPAC